MSLMKKARNFVVGKLEDNPRMSKEDVKDLIRPHYIPDYQRLVEQDIGRIATYIINRIRDEKGERQAFIINDQDEQVVIHVDKSQDLRDIKAVYSHLVKARDSREKHISKVRKRGQEVAGQLALNFDAI